MAQPFKETLKGVGELFAFMPASINRFSDKREDALKSFIYPLLLYPFIGWAFAVNNPGHGADVIFMHGVLSWAGLLGFYAVVYSVARAMNKLSFFWQFINMANGMMILNFVLLLPVFISLYFDRPENDFFTQYWAFYIIADLAFTSFVVARTLRLNIPIGIFLAVINLFLSDIGNRLILFYADHAPWLT